MTRRARCCASPSGATGSLEASWVATGRKMTIAFEVTGTEGHDRLRPGADERARSSTPPASRAGARVSSTILTGPDHPPYGRFCPAPGHHLGFNDLKTIEVRAILDALAGGPRFAPDFAEAARIQACVDAIVTSARERRWVSV